MFVECYNAKKERIELECPVCGKRYTLGEDFWIATLKFYRLIRRR
jgi:hypothetical protein